MGSKNKRKFKKNVPLSDLPKHLRRISDLIEKGKLPVLDKDVLLNDISSFKLSVKYKVYDDIVKTKITIEPLSDDFCVDSYQYKTVFLGKKKSMNKPPYKKLKKSMKKNYEYIAKSIKHTQVPENSAIEIFYKECELMTLYSDKGEEYYEDFLDTAKLFYDSIMDDDINKAKKVFGKLDFIVEECHRRYKK